MPDHDNILPHHPDSGNVAVPCDEKNSVPSPPLDKASDSTAREGSSEPSLAVESDPSTFPAPKKKSKNKSLKKKEREKEKSPAGYGADDEPPPYLPRRIYDCSVGALSAIQERLQLPPRDFAPPDVVCSEAPPRPSASNGVQRLLPPAAAPLFGKTEQVPPKPFRTLRFALSKKLQVQFLESIGEYGFVAAEDIGYGELLLRDAPIAILDPDVRYEDQRDEFGQQWGEMCEEAKKAFCALAHRVEGEVRVRSPGVDKEGSGLGVADDCFPHFAEIFRANGVSVSSLWEGAEGVRTAVLPVFSRFNHAVHPNCSYREFPEDDDCPLPENVAPSRQVTVPASGMMVYANRAVVKGEECTISYLGGVDGDEPPLSREEASAVLERCYGFRLAGEVSGSLEKDRAARLVWENRKKVDDLTKEMAALMLLCKSDDGEPAEVAGGSSGYAGVMLTLVLYPTNIDLSLALSQSDARDILNCR